MQIEALNPNRCSVLSRFPLHKSFRNRIYLMKMNPLYSKDLDSTAEAANSASSSLMGSLKLSTPLFIARLQTKSFHHLHTNIFHQRRPKSNDQLTL
jgi:hypothetical protein